MRAGWMVACFGGGLEWQHGGGVCHHACMQPRANHPCNHAPAGHPRTHQHVIVLLLPGSTQKRLQLVCSVPAPAARAVAA